MPNQEATTKKSFRVKTARWHLFLKACHEQGTTGTAVLVQAVENYIRRHGK